jgi:plastocyanin
MRRLAFLLVIASLLAAVVAASAFAATNVSWKIGSVKTVKIRKGGTVKWIWADGAPHNVKGPGFTSKTVSGKGKSYSHKFGKKGTFKIYCQVHPSSMKTKVVVG